MTTPETPAAPRNTEEQLVLPSESICDQIKTYWRDVLTDANGPDWNRGFNEALMICVDIVRQNAQRQFPARSDGKLDADVGTLDPKDGDA